MEYSESLVRAAEAWIDAFDRQSTHKNDTEVVIARMLALEELGRATLVLFKNGDTIHLDDLIKHLASSCADDPTLTWPKKRADGLAFALREKIVPPTPDPWHEMRKLIPSRAGRKPRQKT